MYAKGRLSKNGGTNIRPGPVDIIPGVILSTKPGSTWGPAQLAVIPGANPLNLIHLLTHYPRQD